MSEQFWVGEEQAGKRLDLFLSESVPTLSRRAARTLCEKGGVLIGEHVRLHFEFLLKPDAAHRESK